MIQRIYNLAADTVTLAIVFALGVDALWERGA